MKDNIYANLYMQSVQRGKKRTDNNAMQNSHIQIRKKTQMNLNDNQIIIVKNIFEMGEKKSKYVAYRHGTPKFEDLGSKVVSRCMQESCALIIRSITHTLRDFYIST